MLKSLATRISISCPECRAGIALQGIVESEKCESCNAAIPMTKRFTDDIFYESVMAWALFGLDDKSSSAIDRIPAVPSCEGCQRPIADGEIKGALAAGAFTCPGCASVIRVRASDAFLEKEMPLLRYMVGEAFAPAGGAAAFVPAAKPIAIACASCSAPLTIDGASRTVTCQYCKVSNVLPEEIWHTVRPVRQRKRFYLVFEIEESEYFRRRYQGGQHSSEWAGVCSDELVAELRGPGISELALRAAAGSRESDIRAAVAGLAKTPADVLASLAGDQDDDVKVALATNPNTPAAAKIAMIAAGGAELWTTLLATADRSLMTTLAGGANTPPDLLVKLSEKTDPSVLAAVAANSKTPPATIAVLAKHTDPAVVAAASENPSRRRWWQFS